MTVWQQSGGGTTRCLTCASNNARTMHGAGGRPRKSVSDLHRSWCPRQDSKVLVGSDSNMPVTCETAL
jgi:hypothetical protein